MGFIKHARRETAESLYARSAIGEKSRSTAPVDVNLLQFLVGFVLCQATHIWLSALVFS